jgi:GAF domain-containing protein
MSDAIDKDSAYREARRHIAGLTSQSTDPVATMASVSAVLFELLPAASWVGFYRVVAPGLLRVGPYQGPVGCLEIPFDKGVCGAAARELRTQIVPDVHSFPGHIACDSRARSEIVVPVTDPAGRLVAVIDLDSHQQGTFDEVDREHLEAIAILIRGSFQSD